MSIADKPERAEHFLRYLLSEQAGGFDAVALQGLQIVSSEHGRLVCRLPVEKRACNRYGTLHGGCIGTVVDVVGSAALVTQSMRGGVSLAINTIYLNPAPCGETVEVDAQVIKLGRDIATIQVMLRRATSGEVIAHGTHVKKLVGASDLTAFFELVDQQLQSQQQSQQQPQQQQSQQQQQQLEPQQQQPQQQLEPKQLLRSRL